MNTTGANIDCKKETVSLKFGEDEIQFHFSKFQDKPIYHEFEEQEEEGNTITSLAALFYETPDDDLERSLVENDNISEDIGKMEIDVYLDFSLL